MSNDKELSRPSPLTFSDFNTLKEIFVTQKQHLEFSNQLYAHIDASTLKMSEDVSAIKLNVSELSSQMKVVAIRLDKPSVSWMTLIKLTMAFIAAGSSMLIAIKALGL